MNHKRSTIIAAACGSREALARIIPIPDEGDLFPSHRMPASFVAALLLIDPTPSPLAAAIAASLLDPPPADLVALVERNASSIAKNIAGSKRLLQRMNQCPPSLWNVVSLLAVDAVLDDPEARDALLSIAANDTIAIAHLMQRIGVAGWRRLTDAQQCMLLDAILQNSNAAAHGIGAIAAGLDAATLDAALQRVCFSPISKRVMTPSHASAMVRSMGMKGWMHLSDAQRDLLMRAGGNELVRERPWIEWGVDTLHVLTNAIEHDSADPITDIPNLFRMLGPKGWSRLPPSIQERSIASITGDPALLAASVRFIWSALDEQTRLRIISIVSPHPIASADLVQGVGAEGWAQMRENERVLLRRALFAAPFEASHGIGAVWPQLAHEDRQRLLQELHAGRLHVNALLPALGARGWQELPDEERAAFQHAILCDPNRALLIGGDSNVWNVLDPETQTRILEQVIADEDRLFAFLSRMTSDTTPRNPALSRLLYHVCDNPYGAMRTAFIFHQLLSGEERDMIRSAIISDPIFVARALANGAEWRPWMLAFVPSPTASEATLHEWRRAAARLQRSTDSSFAWVEWLEPTKSASGQQPSRRRRSAP